MNRAVLLAILLTVACKKTPEPNRSDSPFLPPQASSASAPAPLATPPAAGPPALPPVEITWVDPPAFKRADKPSAMRKASYVVPRAGSDAEDGELAVFYFGPGQGGGLEANVQRWVKQFTDVTPDRVKREDRNVNGMVIHVVQVESGTFNANVMSAGPAKLKKDYGLLGAIAETPSGAYFFKLTGPKATVLAAKTPFYALLDSVKPGT